MAGEIVWVGTNGFPLQPCPDSSLPASLFVLSFVFRPETGRVRCFVSVLPYYGRSDTSRIPSPVPPEDITFPPEAEDTASGGVDGL